MSIFFYGLLNNFWWLNIHLANLEVSLQGCIPFIQLRLDHLIELILLRFNDFSIFINVLFLSVYLLLVGLYLSLIMIVLLFHIIITLLLLFMEIHNFRVLLFEVFFVFIDLHSWLYHTFIHFGFLLQFLLVFGVDSLKVCFQRFVTALQLFVFHLQKFKLVHFLLHHLRVFNTIEIVIYHFSFDV